MRKLFFVSLAGLGLLLSSSTLQAQSRRQAKDSSVTIVFAQSSTPAKKRRVSGDENIVKISPLGFVTGSFPLSYERKLTDFLGLEIAGGLTNRNYLRGAFLREEGGLIADDAYPWSQANSFGDDEAEALYSFNYRKPEMGYLFRAMPKLYFDDDAPEGSYIGLQYNFAKYKFSIPRMAGGSNGSTSHKGSPVSEYENVTDYMVYFGHQIVNDRLTFESGTGIGMRKVSGMKYVATTSNGNVVDGLAPYKQNTFNFGVLFTVGYHF